jgi:HK97 family phage major capsid protein
MSYTSNRTLLEKADLAIADLTAGGGILLPAQAQKFLRLLVKQSVLMQAATVVPMPAPKYQVSKIRLGSRILRPGHEGVALTPAERSRPDLSFLELDAQLVKAEVHLSDEVLEDNIERGELRQTILEMIAEAAGRDMEEIVINGDKTSADPFLAVLDGVLKQSTSHVVDVAGGPLTKNILRDLLKSLPTEYLRDKKAMSYLTSVDADLEYRPTLGGRRGPAARRAFASGRSLLHRPAGARRLSELERAR